MKTLGLTNLHFMLDFNQKPKCCDYGKFTHDITSSAEEMVRKYSLENTTKQSQKNSIPVMNV